MKVRGRALPTTSRRQPSRGLDTPAKKQSLNKSLEAYKTDVASDPDAKFWIRDINSLQETGYRYVNDLTLVKNNSGSLPTHTGPEQGWPCSLNKYLESEIAVSKLQLPTQSVARYRLEFDLLGVKNNCRAAFSRNETNKDVFELICKDVTEFGGSGGGIQFRVDGSPIPIERVYRIEGGAEDLVDPTTWR